MSIILVVVVFILLLSLSPKQMNNNDQSKEHSNAAGSTTGNMAAQVDDALAQFIDSQMAGIQARFEEEYSEIIRTLKAGVAEEQAKNKQLDEELKIFQSKDKDIWDEIRLRAPANVFCVCCSILYAMHCFHFGSSDLCDWNGIDEKYSCSVNKYFEWINKNK